MSRVGVIFTAFNMQDYVAAALAPWVAARTSRLDDHEFVICAVSVPFAGFPNEGRDSTLAILRSHLEDRSIDHIIDSEIPMPETEARGAALTWLKTQDVDLVIQVDADEFFTERDISRIFRFVESNPFVPTFRLSLKNYVFDTKTYLAEPFTPMRIHRVKLPANKGIELEASGFWADNNVYYGTIGAQLRDDSLACLTIPTSCAWITHFSWLSCPRGRQKVEYQLGRGWTPSFMWDYENNKLIFNPSRPIPCIMSE